MGDDAHLGPAGSAWFLAPEATRNGEQVYKVSVRVPHKARRPSRPRSHRRFCAMTARSLGFAFIPIVAVTSSCASGPRTPRSAKALRGGEQVLGLAFAPRPVISRQLSPILFERSSNVRTARSRQ